MPEHHIETPLFCPKCRKRTRLLERLWSTKTGNYVYVYKCQCGELIWED